MFIEPTSTWVPSEFSGYIRLDKKNCLKKKYGRIVKGLSRSRRIPVQVPKLRTLDKLLTLLCCVPI